jgi:16S rRNA (cytosine1402-N4)-methyltransferase
MGALKAMLRDLENILSVGSRVVVISYHSLEDRLVKRLFKTGNIEGKIHKDTFGNILNPYKQITKRVVVPDENELKINSRSRSAKLRIAEYVGLDK